MWKICFIFHKQHLFQELGSRSYILHTKEKEQKRNCVTYLAICNIAKVLSQFCVTG